MGNWYGPQDRGKIFGAWTMNQYVGNIIAAIIVSIVIYNQDYIRWIWALMIPAVFNIMWGLTCIVAIPQAPEDVGIETELSIIKKSYYTTKSIIENIEASESASSELRPINGDAGVITLYDAIRIPRVMTYIVAFSLYKYINYIIFFWLPFYLALKYKLVESILITILYDVGMMPSAYVVEFITEKLSCRRACVIFSYILCLCPLLYVFANLRYSLSLTYLLTHLTTYSLTHLVLILPLKKLIHSFWYC
jgi:sugar phosphate permease